MMKAKSLWILLAGVLFLLAAALPLYAKGMYVRDWITISVRSGPYEGAKITGMANTNDYLEILKERDQWAKVRTPGGKEGWVQNRYLTDKTPKALIIGQLNEKVQALNDDKRTLSEENKQLRKENREQKYRISSQGKEIKGARKDFEDLQKASTKYLELKSSHDELITKDQQRTSEMELLRKENKRLKTSERLMFTLIGGAFIILGLALGIFLQMMRGRPKKAGYRF